MKALITTLSLSICFFSCTTSVSAAGPHEAWMELVVGKWSAEGTDGRKWQVEIKPVLDGKAVIVAVENSDGTSGVGLIGWEPDAKNLVETGYGSDGGYWKLSYTSVTDNELKGHRMSRSADGTKEEGDWRVWREGNDTVHWSFEGKDAGGKEVKFTGKHVRMK